MKAFLMYLHVVFGTFMSYIFTTTLTKDARARLIFERLIFAESREEKIIERIVLFLIVFGVAYMVFQIVEPFSYRQAVAAGLGATSIASVARSTIRR